MSKNNVIAVGKISLNGEDVTSLPAEDVVIFSAETSAIGEWRQKDYDACRITLALPTKVIAHDAMYWELREALADAHYAAREQVRKVSNVVE